MSRFKAFSVIIHIAGWLLFMAFPLLFLNNRGQNDITWSLLQKHSYWLFCYTYIFLFYSNAYFFIPQFFLKRKYVLYSVIVLLLFGAVYYLQPFDKLLHSIGNRERGFYRNNRPPFESLAPGYPDPGTPPPDGKMEPRARSQADRPGQFPPPTPFNGQGPGKHRLLHLRPMDSISLFIFMMIMALSTAIRIIQQWRLTERRAIQAEADKTTAELSFLKAQINPRFLFNTLNNIYTLAVIKDDHAADSIMKLSNIMRYVTDDVVADQVPLQNEVDCISDYIELQRLRIGSNTRVNFIVTGDVENKKIAPLVLMTFIENVFKYGVSKHEKTTIDIKIGVSDTDISFFCRNHIFVHREANQRGGIGIRNTQLRLNHLYPDKHLLNIWNEDNEYSVQLIINQI
jgi:hypothetical protein